MIDRLLLPPLARILAPPARLLRRAGVSADAITLAGFAIGLLGAALIATGHFGAGLAAILTGRLFDGLDGAVARLAGPTDRGAFLDIALDFFFYGTVPLAFAIADPTANALPAAALLLAFIGTGSSFLAFAVIAERRGLASSAFPQKGLYYLGGLTEGAETLAFFVAMCLCPAWFAPLAWMFAALCGVTALMRWCWGWRAFQNRLT